jgi:hypothetical protein
MTFSPFCITDFTSNATSAVTAIDMIGDVPNKSEYEKTMCST